MCISEGRSRGLHGTAIEHEAPVVESCASACPRKEDEWLGCVYARYRASRLGRLESGDRWRRSGGSWCEGSGLARWMGPQRLIRRQEGKAAAAAPSYGLDSETHKTLALPLSVLLGHPTSDFTQSRLSIHTRWLFLCSTVIMTSVDLDCRRLGRDLLATNEVEMTSSVHHRRGSDQSEDLVSLNELLRGAWSAQDPVPAGQSEMSLPERSAGDGGHTVREDCQEGRVHGSRRGANRGRSPRFRRRRKGD